MKRILPLLLIAALLLAACGNGAEPPVNLMDQETTGAVTDAPTEAPTEEPTEAPTEEPTEAPTEALEMLYSHPLTGEPMAKPLELRPFLVSVGNTPSALPHSGFSQADIVFEMFVNDYATRMLALFTELDEVEKVGSCRSLRYPFVDMAQGYDGIVCYVGASEHVNSYLNRSGVEGMYADGGNSFSYRDSSRSADGYDYEHTLYINGAKTVEAAEKMGYRITRDENKDYGLQFAEDLQLGGETANQIRILFILGSAMKDSNMIYDADTGLYTFTQYGLEKTQIDGKNGPDVTFKNVFVIKTRVVTDVNGYHVPTTTGEGDGYFACNGQIVPIRWHRATGDDNYTFTLTDGTPLVQGIGSSYIAIAPTASEVQYQ